MSTLIKNGRVITATDDYVADIFVDGETIKMIGRDLPVKADKTIDATGKKMMTIDPKGGNSNVVTDYDVMLDALSNGYPEALALSFDGDKKGLEEVNAELDKRSKKIDAWLKASNPGLQKTLNRPASDKQITQLERVIGAKLPDDFKESLKIHNGQKYSEGDLIPPLEERDSAYFLMAAGDMVEEWQNRKQLYDSGEFADKETGPDRGIRDDAWWHPSWIPFASNGGGDSKPAAEDYVDSILALKLSGGAVVWADPTVTMNTHSISVRVRYGGAQISANRPVPPRSSTW